MACLLFRFDLSQPAAGFLFSSLSYLGCRYGKEGGGEGETDNCDAGAGGGEQEGDVKSAGGWKLLRCDGGAEPTRDTSTIACSTAFCTLHSSITGILCLHVRLLVSRAREDEMLSSHPEMKAGKRESYIYLYIYLSGRPSIR